jgi:hypothetical protein
MTCHPEADAPAPLCGKLGRGTPAEFIVGAGQGYPGKTPQALATGLHGVLGKKYANDTFYGKLHIQIHAFPSPRVGQVSRHQ